MTTIVNIPRINNEIAGSFIPEDLIDEVSERVRWWLIDSYYRPAMQDYFMARIARWNSMYRSYAWLSSQSIEKMIKFNCLCYGMPLSKDGAYFFKGSKKINHDYLKLFERYDSYSECFSWKLYENIPVEELIFEMVELKAPTIYKDSKGVNKAISFKKCTPLQLVEYFSIIGNPSNRYGAMGISTGFVDVLLLDSLIVRLREQFLSGGLHREFRNALQSSINLFNKNNFEFHISESIFNDTDGYCAIRSERTYPELLNQSNSISDNYAKEWLKYRSAL